jgi:hypothetical protein
MEPVAVRRPGPGQELAAAPLRLPAPAHPVGDQRPLVFGHGAADLHHQLLVRVIARRPVDEDDADPATR